MFLSRKQREVGDAGLPVALITPRHEGTSDIRLRDVLCPHIFAPCISQNNT